jgi:hypothetical protein
MGTRSTIAIQNEDGTVTGIYCHRAGYTAHNGRILAENYTTEAEVRELIALGDLSSLGAEPGEQQDFDKRSTHNDNWCLAYGRDRGETGIDAETRNRWSDFDQEFNYLFTPGEGWTVRYYGFEGLLDEALAAEAQEA